MAVRVKKPSQLRARLCRLLAKADFVEGDQEYGPLWQGAAREGVDRLLLRRLVLSSAEGGNANNKGDQLAAALRQHQAGYLRLRHAVAQILAAMNGAGIRVVCMRGAAVAERYYGEEASLRPASDIDLLLDKSRMLDAKQALWDIGFRPDEVYRNIYQRGDMVIDLHHEPLGYERMDSWRHVTSLRAGDFFEHSESGVLFGEQALLLQPEVELPYLCFHAMKHSFERLVWLYDIARVAEFISKRGTWNDVQASMAAYGLQRPCYYALAYAREHMGASVPEELLMAIRPKMGLVERNLFARHMRHEAIPFLAERLLARMQPDMRHRAEFWRETIYPRYEVRKQIAGCGCVKCNFIRKRLKQVVRGLWLFMREGFSLLSHAHHS